MKKILLSLFLLTGLFSISSCSLPNKKPNFNDNTTDQSDKNEDEQQDDVTVNNDWVLTIDDDTEIYAQIKNNKFDYYSFDVKQGDKFANGGTATFDKNTKIITLKDLTPGDELRINLIIKNYKSIPIKYQTVLRCESNQETFDVLEINQDSQWTNLDPYQNVIMNETIRIKMPLSAPNTVQNQTVSLRLIPQWVQNN